MNRKKDTAPGAFTTGAATAIETFAGALISEVDCTKNQNGYNPPVVTVGDDLQELKRKAALADELSAIITARHWSPAARVTYATLRIAALSGHEVGQWRAIDDMPAHKVADMAGKGVSKNTAAALLQTLESTTLIQRDYSRQWIDERGREIPANEANLKLGHKPLTHTVLSMPAELPGELPALEDSTHHAKARETAKAKRREFAIAKAKLDDILAGISCPHCEDGHLQSDIGATCMQCGAKLSADDLAELIDGEPMPPEPETQSLGDQLTPTVRKLRSLKGKDTPPAPGVTYEFTQDEGVDVHIEPKVWAANNSTAQNVGDVETLRDEQGGAIAYETLTGIATIEYLAGLGAAFSLADGKAGINPRSDDGFDEFNYLDTPMSAGAAVAHLKRGGNVGILPEHSTGLVVLDLDTAAGDFIRAHGWVATGPRIKRANAPDRVKLLVLCPDAGDSLKLESSDGTRKVEVISKRKHAIAAGTHESGAVIECEVAYDLPLIEWARLVAIAQEWTGTKPADSPLSAQPKTRSAQGATGRTSGNMTPEEINAEIIRWNIDHEAEILAMLGNPKEGQYVRLRTERTPSARVTRHDGRIVLIDYGNNNQHIDLFDVFIGEKGIDKRVAVGRLLNGRDIETGILEA